LCPILGQNALETFLNQFGPANAASPAQVVSAFEQAGLDAHRHDL